MAQFFVALLACISLVVMSLRANVRFGQAERLPMQWSFDGTVTWTAPRRFALTLTPALAVLILGAVVTSTILIEPRPGQEGYEVPVVFFIALVFVGVHFLHLRLIERSWGDSDNH